MDRTSTTEHFDKLRQYLAMAENDFAIEEDFFAASEILNVVYEANYLFKTLLASTKGGKHHE